MVGVILAFGEFRAAHKPTSSLISDVSLIPWLVVMVVALLLLGSLTASWCQNMVVLAADREREQAIRAIRAMRPRASGSIINISSRSGLVGIPGAAAYAASKAAVRNHTKTVALYCAEQNLNIRCNSIHPAAILTPCGSPC